MSSNKTQDVKSTCDIRDFLNALFCAFIYNKSTKTFVHCEPLNAKSAKGMV